MKGFILLVKTMAIVYIVLIGILLAGGSLMFLFGKSLAWNYTGMTMIGAGLALVVPIHIWEYVQERREEKKRDRFLKEIVNGNLEELLRSEFKYHWHSTTEPPVKYVDPPYPPPLKDLCGNCEVKWMTPEEVIERHGDYLSKSMLEQLKKKAEEKQNGK